MRLFTSVVFQGLVGSAYLQLTVCLKSDSVLQFSLYDVSAALDMNVHLRTRQNLPH